jgi:sulfite exporter TauE/SafE
MLENISISLAFLLGISSSFHCIGMCGGIISALSLSLPAETRGQPIRLFGLICAYNFGRITSYTIAGGLAGYLVYLSPVSSMTSAAYLAFQILATGFLIALGLHIAGWLPQMKKIEMIGLLLWKYLQPLGRRFIPANTIPRSLMIGLIWGWLPCGLVYSVLLWTLSSADPIKGASYMFMFGLGTLPSMIITALFSDSIIRASSFTKLRKFAGVLIIMLGLTTAYIQFGLMDHSTESSDARGHSHH